MINKEKDKDARERIIEVTLRILEEVEDVDKITVRQIAERAGVGVGLINYHFKTKDNLLSIAIGDTMSNIITELSYDSVYTLDSVENLKDLLKRLCDIGIHYDKVLPFILNQCIINGNMQAQLAIIPILRNIFGDEKDEMSLRTIALQIILPIQMAALSPESFQLYSGTNIKVKHQRDNFIDILIENIIKGDDVK
ncbi:TetR/AcrR family transcriptional regulator [Clostridioides sp. ZZV14-6154]|uniref:TetR/AcrR family transcriptional regulator n=1 Tax=unclassified Clostridioides TaxID=2635829 RepID=UPI001D0F918A|nr:TetR/AcrR family transcriptional regulator [Clostridioides sp. ZZV14-6154]MCC0726044.1 TetR/AcrR family transcriptional regulator [Clostridioides sp. ZZV14-6045]MCC0731781.1 TetR/AcrR family transcriptional regulator [Clostridioides sp. ZZV14-6048]MCC0735109.1 TetR/AcrR family transcriptional regulator [Clostridioides sp. ZZV14-6009]MCC0738889.1 TetR/AcrR family transcriptional regulator [Clostridioides sp. ZZV14-5902]MCC0752401.1 TetR/AcrR family transcriptional regulator [Clostridioides s